MYELTPWGYESEPIFQALGRWAARSPDHDPSLPLSAVSLLLSFRTMFVPTRAEGINARIGFRFGEETFLVHIGECRIEVSRNDLRETDVVLRSTAPVIAAAVYGGVSITALAAEGVLSLEGDQALAERFVTLFQLPPKAG